MRGYLTALICAAVVLAMQPTSAALATVGGECAGVVGVFCEEVTTVCNGDICYTERRYCLLWVMHTGVAWPTGGEAPYCEGEPPGRVGK